MRSRHIMTLQPGISSNQLEEMRKAGISLIVPKPLHKNYPKDRSIQIYGLAEFLKVARSLAT